MKKHALLVIACNTLALIGSAQDKGYIGIGLGGTFAVGDFASSSATNSRAGYATSGAVFDITFASTLEAAGSAWRPCSGARPPG